MSLHHHNHHGHSHSHQPGQHSELLSTAQFNRSFAIAVALNLVFCIVQAIYALSANSMGLLADAGHNFADVLGLIMAWGSNWLLTRDSAAKYSYGYKKTTILAALSNALLLILGSAWIAYESINKLLNPTDLNAPVVIVVGLLGILINGGTALLFLKGQEDLNIKGAFLHLAWDAVISAGVVVAAALIYFIGWLWLDPLIGLGIVAAILVGTWDLLKKSVSMLLDAVPHNIDQEQVKTYLKNLSGVQSVHDLHIWGLSTQEIALTAHLVMPERPLNDHDHEEINRYLKKEFNIKHVTLQVESGHLEDPCGQATKC